MAAYASLANVQALLAKWPISATSKPTQTEVESFISSIAAEIDIVLAAAGVNVPVATPATFLVWLTQVNAYGAAALASAAMFPADAGTGPAGTPLSPTLRRFYESGLAALKDGSGIPPDAPRTSSGVMMSTYLTENPDVEVEDGAIAEPWFKREQVF